MIVVTRLNDSRFAVNPDLIERIHETPDTVLIMVDGAKYVVTEPMAEVIEMIARYRARIVSLAYDEPSATAPASQALGNRTSTGPQLGIVRGSSGSSGSGGAGRVTEFRPPVQAPAVHAPATHAPATHAPATHAPATHAPSDTTQGR